METCNRDVHSRMPGRCARITKSLSWIGSEVIPLPSYDGLTSLDSFLIEYDLKVPSTHKLLSLDVALKVSPTRWWNIHKKCRIPAYNLRDVEFYVKNNTSILQIVKGEENEFDP